MSRKMIKFYSLLMAILMLAGIVGGCGQEAPATATPSPSQSTETAVATPENTAYVPTKDLKITIWNTQGTDHTMPIESDEDLPGDWLIQKTKVEIEDMYGNGGEQWEPKLNLLVAGNTLPDLVMTAAKQGPAHHAKLHEGDLNWELTPEMLQKYAPDVWKAVPQYIWDMIKIDGKIYGIPHSFDVDREIDPNLSDMFLETYAALTNTITWGGTDNTWAIRDDILKMLIPSALDYNEAMALIKKTNNRIGDELVLPVNTTEDFIKLFYDIKKLGLKVGNMPVYATGFNGGDNWLALSSLGAQMMGYKGYFYTGWLDIKNKKMDFGYIDPIFKEAGLQINRMIRDEVIDPESIIHSAEKFTEKVLNGQYAAVGINWVGGIDNVNTKLEEAGKSFRYVPFHTNVPNRPDYPYFKEGPPMFNQTLSLMKTLSEEEVAQVLNWINVQFTDEWEEVRYWGPKEAGLWEEVNGKRVFKDPAMQKAVGEGDLTAMDWRKAKGLIYNSIAFSGGTCGFWEGVKKWNNAGTFDPRIVNEVRNYTTLGQAMMFKPDSKYVALSNFVPVPNVQSWSAEYANIPEVQQLWSTRATWDDPFKVALTMKSDEEFNAKWDDCIKNFYNTLDVDKMLEEQTKIMLPLLEKRQAK